MLIERGGLLANDSAAGTSQLWLPTQFGNLLYWGRADMGVTLTGITTPDPSTWALGGTNLTRTLGIDDPFGGTAAVRFTDTVDGGPLTHTVSTGNLGQLGPSLVDMWIRPFGTRFNFFAMQPSTSVITYLDWTLGTFSAPTIGTVLARSGNWFKVRLNQVGNNQPGITLYTAQAVGNVTYTGLGNYGFDVYLPSVEQFRVSAWADQGPAGNHATQGTAASQQFYQEVDTAGLWIPRGTGGVPRVGVPGDQTNKNLNFPAAVVAAFTGNGKPMTLIEIRQIFGSPAVAFQSGFYLSTPVNGDQILTQTTTGKLTVFHTDDGSVQKTQTTVSAYPITQASYAFTYDGINGNIYVNGVGDASNPTDLNVGQETPGAAILTSNFNMRNEFILYGDAKNAIDRKLIENGARARWGMPSV